ncbi:hypothetical protein L218DRAFT_874253, partial [Marasmius fiardii PR-910]
FLNWGLFGALCVQVFLYYLSFPRDRLSLKLVVFIMLMLDTLQTVLITRDAFIKFGVKFADPTEFYRIENLWLSVYIVNALNGAIVQLFFAYRILTLSGSRILGMVVALLAVAGVAAGIASGVQAKIIKYNNLATNALMTRSESWLSIGSACDVLIVICMVTILSRKRNAGLHPATDDAVKKIIWLTVETAIVAVLTMALTFAYPTKAYCNILIDILGKIYSNNFLVILNRRRSDSYSLDTKTSVQPQMTQEHSLHFSTDSHRHTLSSMIMEVKIQRQVSTESDSIKEEEMVPRSPVRILNFRGSRNWLIIEIRCGFLLYMCRKHCDLKREGQG